MDSTDLNLNTTDKSYNYCDIINPVIMERYITNHNGKDIHECGCV